jgi:hypothetical protein
MQELRTYQMVEEKKESQRRSPLKQDPLPAPGESLQDELIEVVFHQGFRWPVVAALLFAFAIAEWIRWYLDKPPSPWLITVLAFAAIVYAFFKWRRFKPIAERLRLGMLGEKVVAQELEELRALGYRVRHDIPAKGYNIDHVLIGPAGVFVIETKTISKPTDRDAKVEYDGERVLVDGHVPDRDPIKQVKACSDRIAEILQQGTGLKPRIRPVVLYPGWWVKPQPKGVEVWVLNPKAMLGFLQNEDPCLEPREIDILSHALEAYTRSRFADSD